MPKPARPISKADLRTAHGPAAQPIPAATRRRHSARIVARLAKLEEFRSARTIMFYWPMTRRTEVDIRPLITAALRARKIVCLPRTEWKHSRLEPAQVTSIRRDIQPDPVHPRLGLRQPRAECPAVPVDHLDVVLVPGVAFDRRGGRLGRGGGFYDRFLAALPRGRPVRIAAAFDHQIARQIPMDTHDQPVDIVVTPKSVIRARRPRR